MREYASDEFATARWHVGGITWSQGEKFGPLEEVLAFVVDNDLAAAVTTENDILAGDEIADVDQRFRGAPKKP